MCRFYTSRRAYRRYRTSPSWKSMRGLHQTSPHSQMLAASKPADTQTNLNALVRAIIPSALVLVCLVLHTLLFVTLTQCYSGLRTWHLGISVAGNTRKDTRAELGQKQIEQERRLGHILARFEACAADLRALQEEIFHTRARTGDSGATKEHTNQRQGRSARPS